MWEGRLNGPLKEVLPYAVKIYPKQLQLVNEMQKAGVMIIGEPTQDGVIRTPFPGSAFTTSSNCLSGLAYRRSKHYAPPLSTPRFS